MAIIDGGLEVERVVPPEKTQDCYRSSQGPAEAWERRAASALEYLRADAEHSGLRRNGGTDAHSSLKLRRAGMLVPGDV